MLVESQKERLRKLSEIIYKASKKVKILKHISWPVEIKQEFFNQNCQKLPKYTYPSYDYSELNELLKKTVKYFGDTKYDLWLRDKIDDIKQSAELISVCGTKKFFDISSNIYGLPTTLIHDGETKPIDLYHQFDKIIKSIDKSRLKFESNIEISSEELASRISKKLENYFNLSAPKVMVVENLSAKATATSKYIKIRKGGTFFQSDVDQLLNHEAYVHVATTINGKIQSGMKILASNYGAVTKTQEGLAVFSEFITGSMDIKRLRRISDRVKAIQMSIEGANFIDVYRYFIERGVSKGQAFESSRRVFRGGVISGGAPFTKDLVYLDGFIRTYNFLRSAISEGKTECIEILFSGKMDLDDVPIVYNMYKDGIVKKPSYIPTWATDINYLVCFLPFSVFLEDINYSNVAKYYDSLLKNVK